MHAVELYICMYVCRSLGRRIVAVVVIVVHGGQVLQNVYSCGLGGGGCGSMVGTINALAICGCVCAGSGL